MPGMRFELMISRLLSERLSQLGQPGSVGAEPMRDVFLTSSLIVPNTNVILMTGLMTRFKPVPAACSGNCVLHLAVL